MKAWRQQPSSGKGVNRKYKDQFTFKRSGYGMSELLRKMFENAGIQIEE